MVPNAVFLIENSIIFLPPLVLISEIFIASAKEKIGVKLKAVGAPTCLKTSPKPDGSDVKTTILVY